MRIEQTFARLAFCVQVLAALPAQDKFISLITFALGLAQRMAEILAVLRACTYVHMHAYGQLSSDKVFLGVCWPCVCQRVLVQFAFECAVASSEFIGFFGKSRRLQAKQIIKVHHLHSSCT